MSDEKTPDKTLEEPATEEPKAQWEYKRDFKVVSEMRTIVTAARGAAEKELAQLRRKLDKLTYGS
jgi:hypothetical protein